MRAVDKISPPCTFYYEDTDGNEVPFDYQNGMPDRIWHAQHSKGVLVQHSIVFGDVREDKWPVKVLKWILYKLPESWRKSSSMSFNTTINSGYPMIKYLVEQRGFRFNEACVAVSTMCGRCGDICDNEINGLPVSLDYKWPNQYCSYCNVIDPEYVMRRRIWCCYRTMKMGGDVAKAYKDISPNSAPDYFKTR